MHFCALDQINKEGNTTLLPIELMDYLPSRGLLLLQLLTSTAGGIADRSLTRSKLHKVVQCLLRNPRL